MDSRQALKLFDAHVGYDPRTGNFGARALQYDLHKDTCAYNVLIWVPVPKRTRPLKSNNYFYLEVTLGTIRHLRDLPFSPITAKVYGPSYIRTYKDVGAWLEKMASLGEPTKRDGFETFEEAESWLVKRSMEIGVLWDLRMSLLSPLEQLASVVD